MKTVKVVTIEITTENTIITIDTITMANSARIVRVPIIIIKAANVYTALRTKVVMANNVHIAPVSMLKVVSSVSTVHAQTITIIKVDMATNNVRIALVLMLKAANGVRIAHVPIIIITTRVVTVSNNNVRIALVSMLKAVNNVRSVPVQTDITKEVMATNANNVPSANSVRALTDIIQMLSIATRNRLNTRIF